VRLGLDPRWSSLLAQNGSELPAHEVLHVHRILPADAWKEILANADAQNWLWPGSHLSRTELLPIAEYLFGTAPADRALSGRSIA